MAAPTLVGVDDASFAENTVNSTPQIIDADVTFTDPDDDFNGGTLTVSGLLAQDSVSIQSGAVISLAAGVVYYDADGAGMGAAIAIGTAAGGAGATFTVTFNAFATGPMIELIIESLTYANNSDTPTAHRDLLINVTDAAGNDLSSPTAFVQRMGPANPFDDPFIASRLSPALADLDGDGDLDLALGSVDGTLRYLENIGSATAPVYVEAFGGDNPFAAIDVSDFSSPAFADLDDDGDIDLVVGKFGGGFSYFENIGTNVLPVYAEQFGGDNPLENFGVNFASTPTFVDLDGDLDLDMVAGDLFGNVSYFQNVGTVATPIYIQPGANPLGGVTNGSYAAPAFTDVDGDGDFDVIVGGANGDFAYYENTGTTFASSFVFRTGLADPFDGMDVGDQARGTFADVDGDGHIDLVVGNYFGNLSYFENTATDGLPVAITVNAESDDITGTGAGEVLIGTADGESIDGLGGDDVLKGNGGDDTLDGGADNDTLVGGLGADDLVGGSGNDDLNGGDGADDMAGGTGDDYYTTDGNDTLTENAGEGIDTVRSSATFTLGANFENLLLSGTGNLNGNGNGENNTLTGNVGNNALWGDSGADAIYGMGGNDSVDGGIGNDIVDGGNGDDFVYGGGGNDTLTGGAGADYLDGGAGIDAMSGGTGDDIYVVAESGDTVTELANQGTDTVYTSLASYTVGANVENLVGLLGSKQTLNGNAERNTISGGSGVDTIDGKAGNDILTGNGGNNRLTGGAGADQFIFNDAGVGYSSLGDARQVDTVMDFAPRDGDRIDLRQIDADINTGGDQAFHFVTNFTRSAGEATLKYVAASNTTALQLDMDGDGIADYQIQLKGGDFTSGVNTLTGGEPANQGGWIL